MTTLIIDAETKSIYSDSRGTYGGSGLFTPSRKIFQLGGMYYSVVTGSFKSYQFFRNNFEIDKALPRTYFSKLESVTVYVVCNNGEALNVNQYEVVDSFLGSKFILEASFILKDREALTDGSGGDYVRAFLLVGKTPEEAIKLTSKLDKGTDSNVVSIEVLQRKNK